MSIQYTIQRVLIYAALAAYAASPILRAFGKRKAAREAFGTGFVAAVAAWGFRWHVVHHLPLSNLFEVLLFTAVAVYPLSLFCRRALRVGGGHWDAVIGAVVLIPVGFVLSPAVRAMSPALRSPLFGPHVAAYMLGYIVMAKASVVAVGILGKSSLHPVVRADRESGMFRLVCLGFPLLTAGLVLGAVWGKLAWGDWWNWDPKELWSLATLLTYAGFFHLRALQGQRRPRLAAAIVLAGFAAIVITLAWVNLGRIFAGLHSYA
jgi:ABC-type transport system involved in cytochrome c biogenesis permease subunit